MLAFLAIWTGLCFNHTITQKTVATINPNKTERKIKFPNPKESPSSESKDVFWVVAVDVVFCWSVLVFFETVLTEFCDITFAVFVDVFETIFVVFDAEFVFMLFWDVLSLSELVGTA